jgi:hypothetical protein
MNNTATRAETGTLPKVIQGYPISMISPSTSKTIPPVRCENRGSMALPKNSNGKRRRTKTACWLNFWPMA